MTLLADKLKSAGVHTAEARMMTLACDALRESGGVVADAAPILWQKLLSESWVAKDLWLLPYLRERQQDMAGSSVTASGVAATLSESRLVLQSLAPKPRTTPSPEVKARVERIIKSAVQHIQFGYKTADGTDWAQIGAHELDGMDRDGAMARAVKARIGVLTNEDRFRTVGDLITAKQFNEVLDQVRKHPIKEILK